MSAPMFSMYCGGHGLTLRCPQCAENMARRRRMNDIAPELYSELNHAAALLALAADKCRTVDFEGDRFDLLSEAERFDALLAKVDA